MNEQSFPQTFYESVKQELFQNILPYWEKYSRDTRPENEGFFGQINNQNIQNPDISRSIVMTSRFLWTYSAVARYTKNKKYLEMADFAYKVILTKYIDNKNKGVFWSVHPDGTPDIRKKQIYGEAFCCYGLSEYAAAVKELYEGGESLPLGKANKLSFPTPSSGDTFPATPLLSQQAMYHALEIYNLLETFAKDKNTGGYLEACSENWGPTTDMILSPKDMNCPKSMNTNLHVLEAYTNLYRNFPLIYSDSNLLSKIGESLKNLISVTTESILQKNNHLGMFFTKNWELLSDEISYGHDIEASWLLWEAACVLKDENVKKQIKGKILSMAEVSYDEGFNKTKGYMENCFSENEGKRDTNSVWWVQAEAINGFYNAWHITGEEKYKSACTLLWKWIMEKQKDSSGGDWWNELDENGNLILTEDKGGNWKTSYHNGRTCLEILSGKMLIQ